MNQMSFAKNDIINKYGLLDDLFFDSWDENTYFMWI